MAPVPAYDLSMDELSMALSYVSAGLITSAPPAAAAAKSVAPAPAKAEKPKRVRLEFCVRMLCFIMDAGPLTYSFLI